MGNLSLTLTKVAKDPKVAKDRAELIGIREGLYPAMGASGQGHLLGAVPKKIRKLIDM